MYSLAMKRREFLKGAILSLVLISKVDLLLASNPKEYPDLVVATGKPIDRLLHAALAPLGGMKRFVSKGDVVLVKPNIAWDRSPEYAANTNPILVGEIVKECYNAGAKLVKVFDRSVNDPKRCYIQSGIERQARLHNAQVIYPDERKFKKVSIGGEVLKTWEVFEDVLEADKIINVPVAKHHSLARLTMSIKNWMGVIGGFRGLLHQRLDDSLCDLARFIKPTLTILDATRILIKGGPQGGDLRDVLELNTLVVGVDQVSVDAYGATLFGLKPEDVGHIRRAHERGIGSIDLNRMWIKREKVG